MTTHIDLESDESGVITNPDLHDAEIVGVQLGTRNGERCIDLTFRSSDGELVSLSLDGLLWMNGSEFGVQNVVFEIRVFSSENLKASEEYIRELESSLPKLAHMMRDGSARGIELVASVGLRFTAVCRAAKFQRRG